MAEFEFAGMTFRGGKMMVVLTALSTLGGASWGAFGFSFLFSLFSLLGLGLGLTWLGLAWLIRREEMYEKSLTTNEKQLKNQRKSWKLKANEINFIENC